MEQFTYFVFKDPHSIKVLKYLSVDDFLKYLTSTGRDHLLGDWKDFLVSKRTITEPTPAFLDFVHQHQFSYEKKLGGANGFELEYKGKIDNKNVSIRLLFRPFTISNNTVNFGTCIITIVRDKKLTQKLLNKPVKEYVEKVTLTDQNINMMLTIVRNALQKEEEAYKGSSEKKDS